MASQPTSAVEVPKIMPMSVPTVLLSLENTGYIVEVTRDVDNQQK